MQVDPKLEARAGRAAPGRCARSATRGARRGARAESSAAARGTDNLLPLILDAVKAYATVGEIANVLRGAWGEHVETLFV